MREEKKRENQIRTSLFIYFILYVWKQEQNGNTTANAKYFEKNKNKKASCFEKLIFNKGKVFPRNE